MPHCQRHPDGFCRPFGLDAAARACLETCNARWRQRLAGFRTYAGAPWWARGLNLTPELRGRYETWLPVREFCADLARLGERVLPHPSWVPRRLRACRGEPCGHWPNDDVPASMPDLWAGLPERFAGRVDFAPEDLPALYAAIADPRRFGTDVDRYPEQQEFLAATAGSARSARRGLSILDLACGVGLGTYEAATLAWQPGLPTPRVAGLTVEPLEAWMALACRLPHDPDRERRMRLLAATAPPVHFVAADARRVPLSGPVDILLCNGLVGGPYLHREEDAHALLRECRRLLGPDGVLLVANRFHDGRRPEVERVAELARATGWTARGDWRSLRLSPEAQSISR